MCIENSLLTAWVWLWYGRSFLLTFPALRFTFWSFFFHCYGRTFLPLQHLISSEASNAVGGMTHLQRSPRFAERGHYCLIFLLEFSIPAALSSAGCQSRLPSLLPLQRCCFCSLLSSFWAEYQRSKGSPRPNSKQSSLWCNTVGLAGHPVLATGMKHDRPLYSHIKSKHLSIISVSVDLPS